MRNLIKTCVFLVVLANILVAGAQSQVLSNADWPTRFRDAANTSNTPVVLPETLYLRWAAPAGGGPGAIRCAPVVFGGEVVSGDCVYDASSGSLLHWFPDAGDRNAVTVTAAGQNVLLSARPRDYGHNSGYEYFAYDLDSYAFLWRLDSQAPGSALTIGAFVELNAKDGVFYITGMAGSADGIAAVDAATGKVLWQKLDTALPTKGMCSGAAVATLGGQKMVFVGFGDYGGTSDGIAALDASNGEPLWWVTGFSVYAVPSVDEQGGVVYFSDDRACVLYAYDASLGTYVAAAPLNWILNAAPSLGWAKDAAGNLHEAVFVITGGDASVVYAFDRSTLQPLWQTPLNTGAWVSAVYSGDQLGGKLYVGGNNGSVYVLDALTGQVLQTWPIGFLLDPGQKCPGIVEVDVGGTPTPVMYFLNTDGNIAAWSPDGSGGSPPVFVLTASASPLQIPTNSSADVSATLYQLVGTQQKTPIANARVSFSCNAARNGGFVAPTFAYTNSQGVATTKFYSQTRTGPVTVTAGAAGCQPATVMITVKKAGRR